MYIAVDDSEDDRFPMDVGEALHKVLRDVCRPTHCRCSTLLSYCACLYKLLNNVMVIRGVEVYLYLVHFLLNIYMTEA